MFQKFSVLATSNNPPSPKVIFTKNLPKILPILSLFNCRIAFARLIGTLAVSARLVRGFLGISGSFLQPLATGLKKYSSNFSLNLNIARLVPSNGSFSPPLFERDLFGMLPRIRTSRAKKLKL